MNTLEAIRMMIVRIIKILFKKNPAGQQDQHLFFEAINSGF